MPFKAACPACDTVHLLPESLEGKRIRCKNCKEVFDPLDHPVSRSRAEAIRSGPAKAIPKKPPRDVEDDADEEFVPRRTRREETPAGRPAWFWAVMGGSAIAALALGGVLIWVLTKKSDSPPPTRPDQVAQNKDQAVPPGGEAAKPGPNGNKPQPNPEKPKPDPNPPRPNPERPRPNPFQPPVDPGPAKPRGWTVKPDPGQTVKAPEKGGAIPLPQFGEVFFPSTPGPFAAMSRGIFGGNTTIWDLNTLKQIGEVAVSIPVADGRLSPDGKYVAHRYRSKKNFLKFNLDVYSSAKGEKLWEREFDQVTFFDVGASQLVLLGKDNAAQVLDLAKGTVVREFKIPGQIHDKSIALSPGQKYLAIVIGDNVQLWELATGQLAGQVTSALGFNQSLAFSPDGAALAAFASNFNEWKIAAWDMATGDRKVSKSLTAINNAAAFYPQPIAWLHDRSGWLLFGQFLIDYQTGGLMGKLPAPDFGKNSGRCLLTKDHVALVTKNPGEQLEVVTLPRREMEAASKEAQAALKAPTLADVPTRKADWTAVKTIDLAGPIPWKGLPKQAPLRGKTYQPVSVKNFQAKLEAVLFAGADTAQAAFAALHTPNPTLPKRSLALDRMDLATGKALGTAFLFSLDQAQKFPAAPPLDLVADLSPDGAFVMTVDPTTRKRVDLWSSQGKHQLGWVPYDNENVVWVGVLDNKRAWTLSSGGTLVAWDWPEARAKFSVPNCGNGCFFDARRSSLAVCDSTRLTLLDPQTGTAQGQLELPARAVGRAAGAFQRDGTRLALAIPGAAGSSQYLGWELAKGTALFNFSADGQGQYLEWCDAKHLLLNEMLVNVSLKMAVARYDFAGTGNPIASGPGGRHWYARVQGMPNPDLVLASATIPDHEATRLEAKLADHATKVLVKKGSTLGTRVQAQGGPNIGDVVAQSLKSQGYTVAAGGSPTLVVEAQVSLTGRNQEFRTIGGRRRRTIITVLGKKIACRMALTDAQGRTLWEVKGQMGNRILPHLVRGEPQTIADRGMWAQVTGFVSQPLPTIVETSAGMQYLPLRITYAAGQGK